MQHVRVRITADGHEAEIHPMYDLLANAPFLERATAVQWNFTGDDLAILHYVEGDIEAFDAAASEVEAVRDYELEPAGDDAFYAYVHDETTGDLRAMFDPLMNGGVVVVPPIVYHSEGPVSLSTFGPADAIQAAFEALSDPIEVEIEAVSGLGAIPGLAETRLSDRQREAAAAALELGYYEIPRTASHEDVAAELDCAPSTAAEHLRKAEATILRATLGG